MIPRANEIFGENGFVWNRRHLVVRDFSGPDQPPEIRESYLVGPSLTALERYAACAYALVSPLSQELCAMTPLFRAVHTTDDTVVRAAAVPILGGHRDFIDRQHLALPVDL